MIVELATKIAGPGFLPTDFPHTLLDLCDDVGSSRRRGSPYIKRGPILELSDSFYPSHCYEYGDFNPNNLTKNPFLTMSQGSTSPPAVGSYTQGDGYNTQADSYKSLDENANPLRRVSTTSSVDDSPHQEAQGKKKRLVRCI